ncbi:MAG TPA: phospho-N-acetylmuramoyl-pentapeptide-transferase [Tissierellales bacterium]|nr:phospho-N-acetylmuramoyl-pentapeptide-transferase [Tissierellales bacterium]
MELLKINIGSYLISLILSTIAMPFFLNMLIDSNCAALNYKKEEIPISLGILFIIVQTMTVSLFSIIKEHHVSVIMAYLVGFILIGFVGIFDDIVGDTTIKGFKGHISAFFKGRLTTGGLKAGVGFLAALIFSALVSHNVLDLLVNILLIALFINFINLFDLRPGRASKVFILLSIILFGTNDKTHYFDFIIFSFYGILTRYLPVDIKAKAMMGDVGSNSLGLTLGIYCVLSHGLKIKIIYLIVLIMLQILAEKISFSEVIENNKILKYIDNIGR